MNTMFRQLFLTFLIFSTMLIVFSLTLIGGSAIDMFSLSQNPALDKYVQAGLFWGASLIALFGLAGLLAGLVGLVAAIVLRAAELKEEEETPQEVFDDAQEQEIA